MLAEKAHTSKTDRDYLRSRGIKTTIPSKSDQVTLHSAAMLAAAGHYLARAARSLMLG